MKVTRSLQLAALLPLTPCILLAVHISAAAGQDASPMLGNVDSREAGYSPDQLRNQAVQRARSGDYEPAIKSLERILASDPGDVAAYHDLLIILGWAEQDQKALQLAERLDSASATVGVINALGKSARNVGDFEQSVHWYTLAVARAPADLESILGKALALADSGQQVEAIAVLSTLARADQESVRARMARGYIHNSNRNYVQAIVAFDQILANEAEHRGALRGKILALRGLLLPAEALAIVGAHPGLLSDAELARLQTDWAAIQIRWANQTAGPQSYTSRSLDRALRSIESTAEQFPDNDIVQQRAGFDRVVAYSSKQEMPAAVAEFEQLSAAPLRIPAYVLAAAANAYMHLQEPEKAEALLLQALEEEPDNFLLQLDMFWILVDLERQQEALALAEDLRRGEPIWLKEPDSDVVRANSRRVQTEILVGLAYSFMDQLPRAQAQFEQLLAFAPHNTGFQHELATIMRRRGWPERALFEYQQVLAIQPDLVAAAVGNAHALLDKRQFELGEERITELVALMPERTDVRQLEQRWEKINQYQFRIDSSFGKSTGDQFGSKQYNVDGYFYMKPLAYQFRPFAHSADAFAEFPEGDSVRRRLGAGIEYRGVDWVGSLELHGDRDGDGDAGVSAAAEWFVNELWSVSGIWETQSAAVPLRGHRTGLYADQFGLRGTYRASESRSFSVSGEQTRISDGNTRQSWSLRGRQRMFTRPAYKFDLDAGIFVSNSDRQDVVYFSPSSDAAFLVTAINDWRTYRRYDFAFNQQINVELGFYKQSSHGSNAIGSLQYLASIDFNTRYSAYCGVQYGRRVYDGESEYATFVTLGVAGSF